MKSLPYYVFSIALLLACKTQGDKHFIDFETITKDESFRASISQGKFIQLSQGHTYYEWSNPQADTLLVLVHGFSVPSYIWDSTFYASTQRGYSTLRYDNFGRGNSDNPDVVYDVALFANQLQELLDSLRITKSFTLVGLSDGGRTISVFASKFPHRVQNLVYLDAAGFEDIENPKTPHVVKELEVVEFKRTDNYQNMGKGQLSDFYDSIPFRGWDKKYELLMQYKGFVRALISTRTNRTDLSNEHLKIKESNVPVFAIWGEDDNVVKLKDVREKMTTRLPDIKLFVIPKCGHLPHMEHSQQFNAILFDTVMRKKSKASI